VRRPPREYALAVEAELRRLGAAGQLTRLRSRALIDQLDAALAEFLPEGKRRAWVARSIVSTERWLTEEAP
jgi:hypothetical protein